MLSYEKVFMTIFGMDGSQSPSIMECSPTITTERMNLFMLVAVPVNYGMLSYPRHKTSSRSIISRSPRQLWNALLLCQKTQQVRRERRSPRQLWNALLRFDESAILSRIRSQSPSIMECSPTFVKVRKLYYMYVAVPVNYGMLSYAETFVVECESLRRSPRQLWNALLRW